MVHFDATDGALQLDFVLLSNGPVSLFWDLAVLDTACATLASLGYRVVRLDAGSWVDVVDMHDGVARALCFPDYYGRNLDAFNDCLFDVASGDYGMPAHATGLVLVIAGFDAFAALDPAAAHTLVDIYADKSRYAMLFGRRMLCLLQSDDARIVVPPVGASSVAWNPAEWLNSQRGL